MRAPCLMPVLCAALLLAHALAAQPVSADALRVLVRPTEAVGVSDHLAATLEESIVVELGKRAGITVVSPAELARALEAVEAQMALGCDQLDDCMADVRSKLRVERMVISKVSKLGDEMVMTLGLVELASATVGRRVAVEGRDLSALRAQLPAALDDLIGRKASRPGFQLPPGEGMSLAVMPLSPRGVEDSTADAMTQILSAELNRIEGIRVLSRDDIRAMLDKLQTEGELGCTENLECIVEIGAALGLSKLVTGTVGRVGPTFVVSVQLIDTRAAVVENRVLESFDGDADELKNAIRLTAYRIAGVPYGDRPGGVDFNFNVEGARVRVGARTETVTGTRLALGDLHPGRYSLRVLADTDGYDPLQTDVYVAPGGVNVRSFTLRERPTRWYRSWWFWTLTGVVVAAGTTSALILASDSPDNGSGVVEVN